MTDDAGGSAPPNAPSIRNRARVALRKNLARALHAGQPWIYRDALRGEPSHADGSLILVTTAEGRPIGRGFWTEQGPIAIRMLTTEASDDLASLIGLRLETALTRRLEVLAGTDTDAFRWVNGEADLLPGIHLDVYGHCGAIRFDGSGARAFYDASIPDIAEAGKRLGLHTLIERVPRKRRSGADGPDEAAQSAVPEEADNRAGAASRALFGRLPDQEIEVRENGLKFGVDLVHGQKGGLFLDQRDNRQRVRAMANGARVLNLFGYTGGFSVYAAAGGARATTTVDSAAGAIRSARENFLRNGFVPDTHALVVADAFAFLREAAARGDRWDLVVSDPPSFAPNRRALPDALRAYRRLHRLCASVTAPGGTFCAASCSSHVRQDDFLSSVVGGCSDAGRSFVLRAAHGAAADHPVLPAFPEGSYLKFCVGILS